MTKKKSEANHAAVLVFVPSHSISDNIFCINFWL